MCLLNYLWVENAQDAARQEQYLKITKAKDVTRNENKVILCDNVLETIQNDNYCCLNIVIGPKVADTTFTIQECDA